MLSPAVSTTLTAQRRTLQCSRGCRHRFASVASPGRARRHAWVRAQDQQDQQQSGPDRESLLEALEAQARAKRGPSPDLQQQLRRTQQGSRGGSQKKAVVWKEGQLFPEGWEGMDVPTKMYQLYMGERGFLFWANKAALASVGIIIVAWVVFRFLGPAAGLYTLSDEPPSF